MNAFLRSNVEPHTQALAQLDFGRAVKADRKTVETFSYHPRKVMELCGIIHHEGTMEQQLITGHPKQLPTDAHVNDGADCTYEQMKTQSPGKDSVAQDVIEWKRAAMPPAL